MTVYVANGTTFGRSNSNSPETFTSIGQLVAIGQVGVDRTLIPVTNLSSTLQEYVKAIPDGQEVDLVIQYDPDDTGHTALKTDTDGSTALNYRITFPNSPATTATFSGLAINWTVQNIEVDNVMQLNVRIKPTGSLVIA